MRIDDLVIAGVGGQGVILAARVLALAFMEAGYDVKQSEVHGMAQRGGSVQSHVRRGSKVHSPIVPVGKADCVLGFEMLETLRASSNLKDDGLLISSTERIMPAVPVPEAPPYPEQIEEKLLASAERVVLLDAVSMAQEMGERRAANMVLVGALASFLELEEGLWERVIRESVPPKSLGVNLLAFRQGCQSALDAPSQGGVSHRNKEED